MVSRRSHDRTTAVHPNRDARAVIETAKRLAPLVNHDSERQGRRTVNIVKLVW